MYNIWHTIGQVHNLEFDYDNAVKEGQGKLKSTHRIQRTFTRYL